MKLILCERN